MKQKPVKPTGEVGHTSVSRAKQEPEFHPVPFPTTKEDIERQIADPFVRAAAHHGFFPFTVSGPLQQNETDDFDFRLATSSGMRYVELMEVHLREIVQITEHFQQASYDIYLTAQRILERIQRKSRRYRGATSQGIILLTYVTHWQFSLEHPVFLLLSYWLLRDLPVFEQVYYLSFLDAKTVSLSLLYPIQEDMLQGFDPEVYRDRRVVNLNPRGFRLAME
jgi:hypothetical protein